jgi:hypothetical protein
VPKALLASKSAYVLVGGRSSSIALSGGKLAPRLIRFDFKGEFDKADARKRFALEGDMPVLNATD